MTKQGQDTVKALIIATAAALSIVLFVYFTLFKPCSGFVPGTYRKLVERDALSELVPPSPLPDVFSEQQQKRFEAGDGFEVTFKIHNDPRKDYKTSTVTCSLTPVATCNFNRPKRRALVAKARPKLESCIAEFTSPITIPQTLEIGIDDTEGVSDELKQLVSSNVRNVAASLASSRDPITAFLFRLSNTDYLNYELFQMNSGTPDAKVDQLLDHIDKWLLKAHDVKLSTSLATGLFNHLKVNQTFKKRRILIFGDGLENHPSTVSFYKLRGHPDFLAPARWNDIDQSLSKFESFPDLRYANITWYFNRQDWIEYHFVPQYWAHVFTDKAHALHVNMVY